MRLEFIYYESKVTIINPEGNAALLTLWSKIDYVIEKLQPLPSNLAAVSNFFGDGISQLLVNLLNNPQITDVFITGNNRAGSLEELMAFFEYGVEEVKLNGSRQWRIRSTTRLVNSALAGGPGMFNTAIPKIHHTAALDAAEFENLRQSIERVGCLQGSREDVLRTRVELHETKVDTLPSVIAGHQIVTDTPLDAWREVLFLIVRYGLSNDLAKGQRKELLNLKVVITEPGWASDKEYESFGLDKNKLMKYAGGIVDPTLPADTTYTYGHRLRTYFGFDAIEKVKKRLLADKADRKCYITTWDQTKDMEDDRGHPCLVSLFFRVLDDKLMMTATFRTHRAFTAYVENLHGLMAIQEYVAVAVGVEIGSLTVFSQSISIDPSQLPLVESVIAGRKWKMKDDGRGEVVFSLDNGKAVVEHKMGGLTLHRYESSNIEALAHHLAQDYLVSDLNHALYLGRQLGKFQMCLKHGLPYEES